MARVTARRQLQTSRESLPPTSVISPACGRPATFAVPPAAASFADTSAPRCDVCDAVLDPKHGEEQGTGVYLWARGRDVRREIVPLCPTCSQAVYGAAVGFFDFEDEE